MIDTGRNSMRVNGRQRRLINVRSIIPKFLIVCEGERTEPYYFESFSISTETDVIKVDVRGIGYNTLSLVYEAINLKSRDDYQQVWCVFDKDSFSASDFNSAITVAQNNGMPVAYSNEAFELWYLLHYHYCNTATSRESYGQRLSELMAKKYKKNSRSLYRDLLPLQPNAIQYATKLLNSYNSHNPAKDNPCTTVHLLVLELNKYIM